MKRYFIKWFSFLSPRKQTPRVEAPAPRPRLAYDIIRRYLDNIPNLNYGGCGISALVLFDHAEAAGLKPKIVFGYSTWDCGYDENKEYKRGNRQYAESASHIFISFGGKDYDSDGEYKRKGYWMFDDEITRDHLVDSIRHGCWNPSFDRKKYLPRIENFIGYQLV